MANPKRKSRPVAPSELTKAQKKHYLQTCAALADAGSLETCDRDLIVVYVIAYDRWRNAEISAAKKGVFLENPRSKGSPMPNPWLAIANVAQRQVVKLSAELGLSPAARTKARLEKEKAAAVAAAAVPLPDLEF